MQFNFEKPNQSATTESIHPADILSELEILKETYEILLADARKDTENLRRELDVITQFENKPNSFILPKRNRIEVTEILKQVRSQLIQTNEALRKVHTRYEAINNIIPENPELN